MKVSELIQVLSRLPQNSEAFLECPETSYSWTIEDVIEVSDEGETAVILRIADLDGPRTP